MNTATNDALAGRARRESIIFHWLVGFLSLLVTLMVMVPFVPRMPTAGLDAAWTYALNEAVARHLVFGRDLIFTFGPFGSVYTVFYHPATDAIMLAGSVIMAVGLWSGFALLALPHRPLVLLFLPFVVVIVRIPDAIFMTLPFLLLFSTLQFSKGNSAIRRVPRWPAIILQLLLACAIGILPLIKGSFTGVVALLGLLSILNLVRAKRIGLSVVLALAAFFSTCVGWLATGQPLLALPKFFIAQMPIISGYAEAMSLNGPYLTLLAWGVAAAACVIVSYRYLARHFGTAGVVATLGVAAYIFITFKAGFVRADGHAGVAVGPLLFISLALATFLNLRVLAVLLCLTVPGWYVAEWQNEGIDLRTVVEYFPQSYERITAGINLRLDKEALPKAFQTAKQQIREEFPMPAVKGTVDVYPTELNMLFASDMAWAGRPVPQSYSVYTPSLDRLNSDHLLGPNAPDNVFFTVGPIDERLPSLEDASSWPILLANYRLVGRTVGFMQLEKSTRHSAPAMQPLGTVDAQLNSPVNVPMADGPIVAAIQVRKSLFGKLALTALKLPPLGIDLTLTDGRIIRRRYVASMGQSDFIVSPFVGSTGDFARILAGDLKSNRVRSIRIVAKDEVFWKKAMKVSFSTFPLVPQPDAGRLVGARENVAPAYISTSAVPASAQCAIDHIEGVTVATHQGTLATTGGTMSVNGWASESTDKGISPDEIWLVLTSPNRSRRYFKAPISPRPDVAQAFHQPGLKNTGFDMSIETAGLYGKQELSLYTVSNGSTRRCPLTADILLR